MAPRAAHVTDADSGYIAGEACSAKMRAAGHPATSVWETTIHPDEDRRGENQPGTNPQERLRAELLISGLNDLVPLAQIESAIVLDDLVATTTEQREFALQTIRSLVNDGVMQIGDLPSPGEEFMAWDLSVDAAMPRWRVSRTSSSATTRSPTPGNSQFGLDSLPLVSG